MRMDKEDKVKAAEQELREWQQYRHQMETTGRLAEWRKTNKRLERKLKKAVE